MCQLVRFSYLAVWWPVPFSWSAISQCFDFSRPFNLDRSQRLPFGHICRKFSPPPHLCQLPVAVLLRPQPKAAVHMWLLSVAIVPGVQGIFQRQWSHCAHRRHPVPVRLLRPVCELSPTYCDCCWPAKWPPPETIAPVEWIPPWELADKSVTSKIFAVGHGLLWWDMPPQGHQQHQGGKVPSSLYSCSAPPWPGHSCNAYLAVTLRPHARSIGRTMECTHMSLSP